VLANEELEPGRKARAMPHNNEGYDIESARSNGEVDRYIEVKGSRVSGAIAVLH